MKITGTATLHAPPERVWAALNNPAVLVRTIPGCQKLEPAGADAYRMSISAGVASIKGVYQGEVALSDQQPPGSFRLTASGAGAPGTVSADVLVKLCESDHGTTLLEYDADAIVGGMVGGVGQRMLAGVAKKTAAEFFKAVDLVLTGAEPTDAEPVSAGPVAAGQAPSGAGDSAPAPVGVFSAPVPAGTARPGGEFARGALFGGAVALLGVIVGGLLGRRR